MRILSRLPARRAPMAATAGVTALRRDRASDPYADRAVRAPFQLEDRPAPLGAPRGIALAMALGVAMWAIAAASVLIF